MLQAAAALLGALATALACYAAGAFLIHRLGLRDKLTRGEYVPVLFVTGAACVHLLVFAVLTLQIAYWPVLVGMLAILIGVAVRSGAWKLPATASTPLPRVAVALLVVCGGAFFAFYFINAWAPEASPDGSSYHLEYVSRFVRAHGFYPITTSLYAAFSEGVEMVFVPAFAIGRHSAAALTHLCFLLALAGMMLAYGKRIGKPWAGTAGALLVAISPVVGKDASTAYIDVGVGATVFAVFFWLHLWEETRDSRMLIPAGLLGGFAYAGKYTAAAILLFAIGFVAWRAKRWRPVLLLAGCGLVMAGPWAARNWIWYHNPMAPLGNAWFPNRYFYLLAEQDLVAWLRRYDVPSLWQLPLEVTVRGVLTSGILGPVFLLTPLALLALRYPAGRRLLAAGFVMLAAYPANVGTRFLIPALPFFSIALAMAMGETPVLLGLLVMVHAVTSWPTEIKEYAPYAWKLEHFPWKAALRIETPDGYLRRVHPEYMYARMIEDHTPKDAKVLSMNATASSYMTRDLLVSYQSAASALLADILNMGWAGGTQPLRAIEFRFPAQRVRKLRVVQTAQTEFPEQWNVHELRVFHGDHELARSPEWRVRAQPNAWDVQFAFDNSPVTRWRSWEVARPGMFLEADFGREEMVDRVRMETSPDYDRVRFELQAAHADGSWTRVGGAPEYLSIGEPRQVRREAIHELHLRGVDYFLIRDGDLGAGDMREDPDGWGLRIAAQAPGATLYESEWR